jgi:hypothetical protein
LIVTCSSCSVKYTVPDAKVRGRKVRATCKHCRSPILIDGTEKPEPLRRPDLPALIGTDAGDDATRVFSRPDFSVHDEATVVGQIPAAALEAERRYAQRTAPPPANGPTSEPLLASSTSSLSFPAERQLPPYTSEATRLVTTSRGVRSAPPPAPSLETTSHLANELEPDRKRTTYLLVVLATVVVTAVVIVIATR